MSNIKTTYVTFEQAKWLKKKGFDEITYSSYITFDDWKTHNIDYCINLPLTQFLNRGDDNVLARPEQWKAIEWLRVNHGIWISVNYIGKESYYGEKNNKCIFDISKIPTGKSIFNSWENVDKDIKPKPLYYSAPQEAYSAAFDYILKELI